MRPLSTRIAAALCAFALAGCSTHPIIDDVTRVSTYDVVEQIRCEAGRAVRDFAPAYAKAAIAYEFDFDITERNYAKASGTLTFPFVGGVFSVDLLDPTQIQKTRQAVRNFRIVDSFADAKGAECLEPTRAKNIAYPISGDIGAYELVKTFIQLAQASTFDKPETPPLKGPPKGEMFVFADTLKFTTTLGFVGANPALKLNPVTGKARVTDASADFRAQRVDMHSVTIAIAAAKLAPGRHPVLASLRMVADVPGAGFTNNSLLATTLVQGQSNPEQKALYELDRQRILRLQRDVPNLLVGP
jgi:hypothetical protein